MTDTSLFATASAPRVSMTEARLPPRLAAIARHRLFHFVAIGGLLFAIAPRAASPYRVSIRGERLAALHDAERARGGREGTSPEKLREIDQRAVEDEILFREGVRLGLDRNDGIVRQRVVQKVLFLAEELGGASRPASEEALRAFFARSPGRFTISERFRFAHVFAHRREDLALTAAGEPMGGEAPPLPPELEGSRAYVAANLGAPFADALAALSPGVWSEPIASTFGWHRVRLLDHRPARAARFDEVRREVIEAENLDRRQESVARFTRTALARYRIDVDGAPLQTFEPARRVALRSSVSGED